MVVPNRGRIASSRQRTFSHHPCNRHPLDLSLYFHLWHSLICPGTLPASISFLLVPIPEVAVDKIIFFLQAGSAAVAYALLRMLSIPVFKQEFILRMPNLDIEVAKECSGIRSSLALLVTALILGELVLRSAWRKALWVLSIVPILIFKNGVRIVTLCLLTIYVNPGFLHGWLHTSGGIVFYLLGLAMLFPVLNALRKSGIPT